MIRLILLRLTESFFRRWILYLLPVFLLFTTSLLVSLLVKPDYVARGTVYVQKESLLASLTAVQNPGFTWVTPARATVDEFSELIQTDAFIRSIIAQTDLEASMSEGQAVAGRLIEETRKAVWTEPLGNNLIQVAAAHEEGLLAEQIAQALVESYIQWNINADRQEGISAQTFFEDLILVYQTELESSRQAQQVYLEAHPDPVRGERPNIEQIRLSQLQASVDEANTRLVNAVEKLESARLALAQSESKTRQTYLIIDTPSIPPRHERSLRTVLITVAIATAVGSVLSLSGITGAALLDSSYRFPVDVQSGLDLPVLAVVPDAGVVGHPEPAHSALAGPELARDDDGGDQGAAA